jgi:hypothetical protein
MNRKFNDTTSNLLHSSTEYESPHCNGFDLVYFFRLEYCERDNFCRCTTLRHIVLTDMDFPTKP